MPAEGSKAIDRIGFATVVICQLWPIVARLLLVPMIVGILICVVGAIRPPRTLAIVGIVIGVVSFIFSMR